MSAFNGCKVFFATMEHQRKELGDQVTTWIEDARRHRRGFEVVDIVIRQSSDHAFHCVSCVVFFREDSPRQKVRST